jgi:hypothetical protein
LGVGDSEPGERDLEDGIARAQDELRLVLLAVPATFIVVDFARTYPAFLSCFSRSRIAKTTGQFR